MDAVGLRCGACHLLQLGDREQVDFVFFSHPHSESEGRGGMQDEVRG
jgi:hypothetical protein